MNRKKIRISIILILCVIFISTMVFALFFVYFTGKANIEFDMNDNVKINLEIVDYREGKYYIVITADDDSAEMFTRIKAFTPNYHKFTYRVENSEENGYLDDDGFFYYIPKLTAGKRSETIILDLSEYLTDENFYDADNDFLNINVAVIAESTKVKYDEKGKETCDWNEKISIIEEY